MSFFSNLTQTIKRELFPFLDSSNEESAQVSQVEVPSGPETSSSSSEGNAPGHHHSGILQQLGLKPDKDLLRRLKLGVHNYADSSEALRCDECHFHNFEKSFYRTGCRVLRGGCSGTGAYAVFRRAFRFGERGSGFHSIGEVQDFEKIRAQCLEDGVLFEDPEFPTQDSSIFFSRSPPVPFEWKRPTELCDEPRLFIEGASRFDVVQGELGDCWLLAAVANLTLNEELFHRVVPHDQAFADNYAGIFHFRFWQYGRWIDVVIDDRLPTFGGQLVFMHSKECNEFWSALLEKAYAKLHGSYEALKGGSTCEAMEDFTGGVTEFYELADKAPPNLFQIMLKAHERMSLMGSSIEPDPEILEMELPNGLIRGHAYSITSVRLVEIQTPRMTGKIPLLRIRNPWGNASEWTGPWSDKSREWSLVSDEEKEELGLTFEHDGEFWISYKDFVANFSRMEICNLNPDSLDDEPLETGSKKKWEVSMFEGSWVRGVCAGGCRNFLETFWTNPQYRITLEDVDDDDDEEMCTVIIALMQKNHRAKRKMGQAECLTIGYAVYKIPEDAPKPLSMEFFKYNQSMARAPSFINLREVTGRFKLPPGTYCVVPSTFDPGESGDFVLRVFTEKKNIMSENDEEVGLSTPDEEMQQTTEEETSKEDAVKDFFAKLAGEDLEIDCFELQEILNFALKREFDFESFSLDVCRSMIAMMDVDMSGKLGLEEFKNLWICIRTWKNVFKAYDHDGSGTLNTLELRRALHSAGYRVNNHVLQAMVLRHGKEGKMGFDDFLMCAVKLKTMIETFRERDPHGLGRATFTLEEWVEKTMYS